MAIDDIRITVSLVVASALLELMWSSYAPQTISTDGQKLTKKLLTKSFN